MPDVIPKTADEFIQGQLDRQAEALEKKLESDVIAFVGPIVDGVDDLIRSVAEEKRRSSSNGKRLHLILTTRGGYIETVHRIVDTLRHHYSYVAFIVPNYAFSAGTVLALSGDDIYMDYYSRLGPIDPQVETPDNKMVPALGYLTMYQRLLDKATNGGLTTEEANLLIEGFDQAELYKYEQARHLSIALLIEWLATYKFKDWKETETRKAPVTDAMRAERAEEIATKLNDVEMWHSHGHGISMAVLRRNLQLLIHDYEADPELNGLIRDYQSLFSDFMNKYNRRGVLHTTGQYVPFM